MGKKESLIPKISLFKKAISRFMPIKKMILFGSVATGKAKKDSDIDLIIVSKKFENVVFSKRNFDIYDHWNLDYPVDFVCLSPKEFEKLRKQVSIVSEALLEGIEIN